MCESIIELVQLTKRYGHFTAVDRLDLKIHKGEIFGLLGPNGAGQQRFVLLVVVLLVVQLKVSHRFQHLGNRFRARYQPRGRQRVQRGQAPAGAGMPGLL